MPIKKIGTDLEKEILGLEAKEKNKLLLRLIAKDKLLIEQLHFKLLETPEIDIPIRESEIVERINNQNIGINSGRDLFWFYRTCFAMITHHRKVTTDKLSEMRLSMFLVDIMISKYSKILLTDNTVFTDKLNKNFMKKLVSLLKKLNELHEDYRIEFIDIFNKTLEVVHHSRLIYYVGDKELPNSLED